MLRRRCNLSILTEKVTVLICQPQIKLIPQIRKTLQLLDLSEANPYLFWRERLVKQLSKKGNYWL